MQKYILSPAKLLVILTSLFLMTNCKVKQEETENKEKQLIRVSCYSIGQGTDVNAFHAINHTIQKFKNQGHDIRYTTRYWGKEGEMDYCFDLQNLHSDVFKAFSSELDSVLIDRLVHIYPGEKCPTE